MNKQILQLVFWLWALTGASLHAQVFPNDPLSILKDWDYYQLTDRLGDGDPIIDTMAGQAYIAGMRYQETWLNRRAEVSYYFTDTDISALTLTFWSPYTSERTRGIVPPTSDPEIRDSLLQVFRYQDSLRMDSISRLTRQDTMYLAELKARTIRMNAEKQRLYDLDSIRCDSLIHDLSAVMGTPYEQDSTLHTETRARWYALWFNHGLAASLKDYTDYTTISFSVSGLSPHRARAWGLLEDNELYMKSKARIDKDPVDFSLYGVPVPDSTKQYHQLSLLIEPKAGAVFSEKLIDGVPFTKPEAKLIQTGGGASRLAWISAQKASTDSCQIHQIILFEGLEPIILFDSETDLYHISEGKLLPGYQAELTLSDDTRMVFGVGQSELIRSYYQADGSLTGKEDMLIPGCLRSMSPKEAPPGRVLFDSSFDIVLYETNQVIARAKVTWKLSGGFWIVDDYEVDIL